MMATFPILLPYHILQLGFQAVQDLLPSLCQSYPSFQEFFCSGASGGTCGV